MKRIARTSSRPVSFLSFARPEKGDPKSGMIILLFTVKTVGDFRRLNL